MDTLYSARQSCVLSSRCLAAPRSSTKRAPVRHQHTSRPKRSSRMLVLASEERGSGVPQQLGYTDKDSAGQSNIFAVEPKTYVQGSSADSGKGSTPYSVVAGVFAVAAISAGLYITVNNGPVEAPTSGSTGGESLQVIYERLSGSEAPWL